MTKFEEIAGLTVEEFIKGCKLTGHEPLVEITCHIWNNPDNYKTDYDSLDVQIETCKAAINEYLKG